MRKFTIVWAGLMWTTAALSACDSGTVPKPEPNRPPTATATTPVATAKPTAKPTGSPAAPNEGPEAGGPADSAVGASNSFGLDLYRKLAEKPGNLAMSPASLSIALSMTYGGAREETAKQMAKVMHLPSADALHGGWATVLSRWSKDNEDIELAVANRLFGDKSYAFEKPFISLTEKRYAAPLEGRDFKTQPNKERIYINDWVKERTKNRIVDLIPPPGITADTRLVLANAIYFKAAWQEPFNERLTKDDTFYADGSKAVKVPMMNRTAHMRYGETDDVQLLELRYKGGEFATMLALPKQRTGLAAVEAKLKAELVEGWVKELKGQRVQLTMPRFKIDPAESFALKPLLLGMGMELAFDRDKADFTGMFKFKNPEDRLLISNVFHKAFVAVDEKGTEAAAATAVVMARAGSARPPGEPARFLADHPFLFFIRDVNTKTIMFVGRVTNPS